MAKIPLYRATLRLLGGSTIAITCGFATALGQNNSPSGVDSFAPGSSLERITVGNEDFGYFDGGSRWPSLPDGTTIVFVCWEESTVASSAEANWVKLAITDSWQKYSKIDFRGWQTCFPRSSGIRIQVTDDRPDNGPHTIGLGRALDGKAAGMVLNFTFRAWGQPCASSEDERKSCIQSIAVHEFGHAIGFAHEQNRPDVPGECFSPPQGPNGTVLLTPYDPQSVMNYCNPSYNNLGKLSELDIVSVQKIYGKK